MNKKEFDLIIIGAGASGLTAAIYAARRTLSTLVLAKDIGGQANLASHIENYPGFDPTSGFELMNKMKTQAEGFGAQFLLQEVKEINKHFAEHHGISPKTAGKIFNFMEKTGRIFFGDLFESEILKKEGLNSLSEQLLELIIKLRDEAREKKDYNKSDYIRNELKKNGVILNDNDKTTWSLE